MYKKAPQRQQEAARRPAYYPPSSSGKVEEAQNSMQSTETGPSEELLADVDQAIAEACRELLQQPADELLMLVGPSPKAAMLPAIAQLLAPHSNRTISQISTEFADTVVTATWLRSLNDKEMSTIAEHLVVEFLDRYALRLIKSHGLVAAIPAILRQLVDAIALAAQRTRR